MDKNRALEIMQGARPAESNELAEAYDYVIALLSDEPVGEWVHEYDEKGLPTFKHKWRCPVCGKSQTYGEPAYCPSCGARLDKRCKEGGEEQ